MIKLLRRKGSGTVKKGTEYTTTPGTLSTMLHHGMYRYEVQWFVV